MLSTFNFQHNVGNVQELRLHKGGGQLSIHLLIFFHIVPFLQQSSTLFLRDKLFYSLLGRSVQSLPWANSYALLTYKRLQGSGSFTLGIAYVGTACASKNMRVNINLYHSDAIKTAEVRRKGSITFLKSGSKLPSYLMPCRLLLTRYTQPWK